MAGASEYRKTGACPQCGAPIYADASLTTGKNGEVLTVLPQPYYTCTCRFNQQPALPSPVGPWAPWAPCPSDVPYPWPTLICKPSETHCNLPKPPTINIIPTGPSDDIVGWMKQFCGSGSVTGQPFKGFVIY